jgi:hypothetical protein
MIRFIQTSVARFCLTNDTTRCLCITAMTLC